MKKLLIDSEYLKKAFNDRKVSVEELIKNCFGKLNYPDEILSYGALSTIEEQEAYKKIKNFHNIEKGFITKSNGKYTQKAVDGYINIELYKCSQDEKVDLIYLLAGDGDLKPGAEYINEKNKRLVLITKQGQCSSELSKLSSEIVYLESILNWKKVIVENFDNHFFNYIMLKIQNKN